MSAEVAKPVKMLSCFRHQKPMRVGLIIMALKTRRNERGTGPHLPDEIQVALLDETICGRRVRPHHATSSPTSVRVEIINCCHVLPRPVSATRQQAPRRQTRKSRARCRGPGHTHSPPAVPASSRKDPSLLRLRRLARSPARPHFLLC